MIPPLAAHSSKIGPLDGQWPYCADAEAPSYQHAIALKIGENVNPTFDGKPKWKSSVDIL